MFGCTITTAPVVPMGFCIFLSIGQQKCYTCAVCEVFHRRWECALIFSHQHIIEEKVLTALLRYQSNSRVCPRQWVCLCLFFACQLSRLLCVEKRLSTKFVNKHSFRIDLFSLALRFETRSACSLHINQTFVLKSVCRLYSSTNTFFKRFFFIAFCGLKLSQRTDIHSYKTSG